MEPSVLSTQREGYVLTTHRALCRRASIWIGQTCNLRCKFCYFLDKISDPHHPEHAFMSLDKLKTMCSTLVEVYGNNAVDIEGGEPTIYPDIVPLVRHCREIGLKPTLITNALALNEQKCRELKEAGLFDFLISIHSIGEAYEDVVQAPGAYLKLLRGIDFAREAGIPFRFNTVLCPEALPHLMDIARLAVEKGARVHNFINYNPFVDQKDGEKRTRERVPHYTDVARMLLPVIDYLDSNGIEVNIRYMPFCAFPETYRKYVQNFQQIVYDLHEWESAGEIWSGARSQRETCASLDPPVDFYSHIYALRQHHFHKEVQSVQGQRLCMDNLLKKLEVWLTNHHSVLSLALYGGGEINRCIAEAIQNHPVLSSKFQKPVFISSTGFRDAETLFGYTWQDDSWLKANPTDLVVITANISRHELLIRMKEMGLGDRTLNLYGNLESSDAFDKLFYLPELGQVEGFSDMEHAYKEYRVIMTKAIHPYSKGEKCYACSLVGICDGYHRDYAEFFGFDELTPVLLDVTVFDPCHYMKEQPKIVEQEEYEWALPPTGDKNLKLSEESKSAVDYAAMQKDYYAARITSEEEAKIIVHCNFNACKDQAVPTIAFIIQEYTARSVHAFSSYDLGHYLRHFNNLPSPQNLKLLDFGCGVGRLMEPLARHGYAVDGVDISPEMINYAKQNLSLAKSSFFVSDGLGCGDAPNDYYDISYSQICIQHIPVREIRKSILKDIARTLRPGGMVAIQMHYYPDNVASTVPPPHVPWSANKFDATTSNSEEDVWITYDELQLVIKDFQECFNDVRVQFIEFPNQDMLIKTYYGNARFWHIWITASKGCVLAQRYYP